MFPCSNASFTWSDRNFCGISLLEFVSKRLVLKRPVTVDYPKSCALTVFGSLMAGLSQLIPLFWRYPIVSNIGLVRHSDVFSTTISDHFLVHCTLCSKIPLPKPSVITSRSCKNFDPESFNADDCLQGPWNTPSVFDLVDDKVECFNKLFLEVLDEHAPIKTFKIGHESSPAITPEIMRKWDKKLKLARWTGRYGDWNIFRTLRQVVKSDP